MAGSTGDSGAVFAGGSGGTGQVAFFIGGGGGGGGAGSASGAGGAGGNSGSNGADFGSSGGTSGNPGSGNPGYGGAGGGFEGNGVKGIAPGGGGGGGGGYSGSAASGAAGMVVLSWGGGGITNGVPPTPLDRPNPDAPGVCPCPQQQGNPGNRPDPVNMYTGAYNQSDTDASVATFGPPLVFRRAYDSSVAQEQAAASSPGPLGYGWTDNWNVSLSLNTPSSGDVTVNEYGGAEVVFTPPVSGACVSPNVGPGTTGTYCALPEVTATLSYSSGSSTYTLITHPYEKRIFDSSGKLASDAGPGGATSALSYNTPSPGSVAACPSAATSCTTVTSASGRTLVLALNSSAEVTRVTDPLGHDWLYGYCSPPSETCSSGDLISVTDPLGNITTYSYDEENSSPNFTHELLTIKSPNEQSGGPNAGSVFTNTYNSTSGRIDSQTDANGNVTTYDFSNLNYTSGSGYTTTTDPDGNETKYVFDTGVLLTKTLGADGGSPSTWSYDPDSLTLLDNSITDPNGNTTSYTYDDQGNVTSRTNALGNTWTYGFNSFDEPTCVGLPLAAWACSALSPPSAITGGGTVSPPSSAPPKYVTYSEYDTDGNLVYTTTGDYAPGGSTASQSRTSYSLTDGESVTLSSVSHSCATSPPDSSLPCLTIDPNKVDTQLGYDSAGDVSSVSALDGNSGGEVAETTYAYDGDGEQTSVTAPNGNLSGVDAATYTTTNTYDDDGELTAKTVSETSGGVIARTTSYGYDADGNLTSRTTTTSSGGGGGAVSVTTPAHLVAAYGFDEGSGSSVADGSGNGNTGTITNATWTSGKFGGGLDFNGTDALVSVPDSSSLHLSSGMTLEAWVKPSSIEDAVWADVIYKPDDVYYLEAETGNGAGDPIGGATIGGTDDGPLGSPLTAGDWAYLAVTYNGSKEVLYVNGEEVAETDVSGSIASSTDPLGIGGDSLYGQWFAGVIDEVRIYDGALSAQQIERDMATPVDTLSDTSAPSTPADLSASELNNNEIDLSWDDSTDDVGVSAYEIERCAGVSCSSYSLVGSTENTEYADSNLSPNTSYSYKVRALDAAANASSYSTAATASTTAALVAAYGFDEGTGSSAGDSSTEGNDGAITAATWTTSGKFGDALSFDSSSNVEVPDSASLELADGMTVEAWVKPTTSSGLWQSVVAKGTFDYYLEATTDTGGAAPTMPSANGTFGGDWTFLDATDPLTVNEWSQLARPTTTPPCASTSTAPRSPAQKRAGRDQHLNRRPLHRLRQLPRRPLQRRHRRSPDPHGPLSPAASRPRWPPRSRRSPTSKPLEDGGFRARLA